MKLKIIFASIICLLVSGNSFCQKIKHSKIDSLFLYHFRVLDSLANNNFVDSTLLCIESIKFMEINTGISSSSGGNYFGKTSFTSDDLKLWHSWYEKRKKNCIGVKKKKY